VRGGANFPGSPIAVERQLRAARDQELNDTLSRVALGKQRLKAEEDALRASRRNAVSSPVRGGAAFPGSPRFAELQQQAAKRTAEATRRQERLDRAAQQRAVRENERASAASVALERQRTRSLEDQRKQAIRNAVASPVRGGANFPGSPIAVERQLRQARDQELNDTLARVALGKQRLKAEADALNATIKNAAASPVRGGANFPGSPAALEAERRAALRNGIASPIRGGANFPGSPIALEQQLRKARSQELNDTLSRVALGKQRLRSEEDALRNSRRNAISSPVRGGVNFPGSPLALEAAERRQRQAERADAQNLRADQQQIARFRQRQEAIRRSEIRNAISSPVRGGVNFPGSPLALEAEARAAARAQQAAARGTQARAAARGRAREIVGSGLIGGGFPLLFGQGGGAGAGGALGGLLGGAVGGTGGFAGGIVGSLIGTQFDKINTGLGELSKSLKDPTAALQAMDTAGLRTGDSLTFAVQQLVGLGRATEAQTAIFDSLRAQLGDTGVRNILLLAKEVKRLDEANQKTSATLATVLSPALTEINKFFADIGETAPGVIKTIADGIESWRKILDPFYAKSEAERQKRDRNAPLPSVPLTPEQQLGGLDRQTKAIDYRRQQASELRGLENEAIDMRREAEDKIFELRRRGADIELEKTQLRLSIEDEIFRRGQELANLQAGNQRSRAQLAIERTDLGLAQRAENIGGPGAEFIDKIRDYIRIRSEGEANLQLREKQIQLEIQQDRRDVSQFELQVADRVRAINRQVEDYTRDVTQFELNTERKIGEYKIKIEEYLYKQVQRRYDLAANLEAKRAAAAELGGFDVGPGGGSGQGGGAFSKWSPDLLRGTAGIDRKYGVPIGSTASLFMFESGGSTSVQRRDNRATGLFQVMPDTARELGTTVDQIKNMGGLQQLVLFDRYLQNRGFKPGMSVQQMYATVLGGNPYAGGRDSNGTTPGSGTSVIRKYIPSAAAAIAAAGVQAAPGALAAQAPAISPAPAIPTAPTLSALPQAPAGVGIQDLTAIYRLQTQTNQERQRELEIQRRLEEVKASAALLAITSTRDAQDRLTNAKDELDSASALLSVDTSRSEQQQELLRLQAESAVAYERIDKALLAASDEAIRLYQAGNLDKETYIQILTALEKRNNLEKEILRTKEQQLLVQQEQARNDLAGNNIREFDMVGRGASRGLYGGGLQKYNEAFNLTGDEAFSMEQAKIGRSIDIAEQVANAQIELNRLADPAQQIISAANGIGDAFGGAFRDVTSGSKNAQEALSDMFKNIGASFLDMASQILAQQTVFSILKMFGLGLGGAGGGGIPLNGFAQGGMPPVGKPSIVGEYGPELFVPSTSGTIVPTGAFQETAAVANTGLAVLQQAAAEQAALRESSTSPTVIEWRNVGDLDVVTRDQFVAGMAAAEKNGAKRGQALVTRSMKRDPGFRAQMR
jgi:hypothetical protein